MARAIEQNLLPEPKAPPRWKGLALKFLFWIVGYGVAGLAVVGILNIIQWM